MAAEIVATIAFLAFGARNFPVPGFNDASICRLNWQSSAVENGKSILLGGAIRCAEFGSRSVLIQSMDGGKSWMEVGVTKTGRTAAFLQAPSKNTMYAVLKHIEEGPGPDTLVRSDNGGKRWREVADIPKGEHPNQIVLHALKFTSVKKGYASLRLFWGNETHVAVDLSTENGGARWQFGGVEVANNEAAGSIEVKDGDSLLHLSNGNTIQLPKEVLLAKVAKRR